MRLAPKIFLVSALVIAVLCAAASWSLLTVKRLVTAHQDITTRSVPALRLQGTLRESIRSLMRLEARWLVLRDQDYAAAWNQRAAQMADGLQELGGYLETPGERAAHEAARTAFHEYRRHVESERRLVAAARGAGALKLAEGPAREAAQRAETALTEMTAAGTWTEPMAAEGRDEIGELGRSFNRMAERLREVDRLKEDFFSQISHDLRSPLASIRLAAETLHERAHEGGDAHQARFAQLIDASAARMLGMVNEILDFTRLRAKAMPLDRRPIDVLKAVVRAMDEMRPMAEEKRVRMDLAADGGDFTALAEEGSLVRVVVNLLGNAISFTPEGGAVSLRLAALGDRLELRVRDTGAGIPPDALPWIFEPYRQAHGRRQGTGLGLAVVKGLVDAHGGTVRVESEPGKGSCFTVTIPKTQATA